MSPIVLILVAIIVVVGVLYWRGFISLPLKRLKKVMRGGGRIGGRQKNKVRQLMEEVVAIQNDCLA
jgi:hypothetical protein